MPKRRVNAILLCEDQQQQVFVYQWLKRIGANQITVRLNPPGRGAGDQYVRRQYPIEVRATRRVNRIQANGVSLVTVIDADNATVEDRHRELDRGLADAELQPRQNGEKIAILVPKRNIETWIHHVRGVEVDEETEYPKLAKPGDCKEDVKDFVESSPNDLLKINAPPSLQAALVEMERII